MSLLGFLTRQYFPEDPEEEREPITQAVQRSDTYQYLAGALGDLTRPDGVDRRSQRQANRRSNNVPMRSEDPVYQGAEETLPRRLRQEERTGTSLSDVDLAQRDRVREAVQERRNKNFLSQFELPESPSMSMLRYAKENPGDPLRQVPQSPTQLPNFLFRRGLEMDSGSPLAQTPEMTEARRREQARRDYDAMMNDPINSKNRLGRAPQSFEDYVENYGGVNRGAGRNINGYARFKMEDGKAYYLTDVGDASSWSEIDPSIYEEAQRLTRKKLGPDADMDTYFRED